MKLKYILTLSVLCASFSTQAFKLDTHVWVGAQVIEDVVTDGKVTIPPYGEYVVDQDIVDALRLHPKAYLYGNVGPDFFPDVMAGQLIVHPGAEVGENGEVLDSRAWNTDDWFRHLLSNQSTMEPEEIAFAYGYVAHGAADFWAHTYVNTYSGNIFSLFDDDGAEAEIRHYLLEGFINSFTPNLIKSNGQNVGKGISILNSYNGELPSSFIVDKLMTSPDISDQLARAPHIKVASTLKNQIPKWTKTIDSARDTLYKLIGDLWEEHEAEAHRAAADNQELVEQMCNTAVDVIPAEYESIKMVEHEAKLNELQATLEATAQSLANDTLDDFNNKDNKFHELSQRYLDEGAEFIRERHDVYVSAEQKLLSNKHEIEQTILKLDGDIRAKNCSLLREAIVAPLGIHEYLKEELPFGREVSDLLVTGLDPFGVIGISNPLDPLDLGSIFGGGGGSNPPPPKITSITGDRNFFHGKIDEHQALIDKNPGVKSFVEKLSADELEDYISGNSPDSQFGHVSTLWVGVVQYSKNIKIINRYRAALSGLAEGKTVSIYLTDSSTGYSTGSHSWFCDDINGFIDDSLTGSLNKAQALEADLIDAKNDLSLAAQNLHYEISKAVDIVHSAKYSINKAFQESINDIYDIAEKATSVNVGAVEYAKAIQRIKAKMVEWNEDVCSDQRKFQEFIDDGAIEATPFIGSYLLHKYSRAAGYCGSTNLMKDLYKSYFTDSSSGGGKGCESDARLYVEWLYFHLRTWEKGVNEALAAYPLTQKKVVDAVLDPASEFSDYKAPIKKYMICEAPKFIGVPPHAVDTGCVLQASAESLNEKLASLKKEHDRFVDKYLLGPIPDDIKITKAKIDAAISDAIESYTREKLEDNEAFRLLEYVIDGSPDDPHVLNNIFSQTDNNYMTFDSNTDPFSQRVIAEMYVSEGQFDPNRFSPAYNAVILAKLSLLGANELNRLVEVSGGNGYTYGSHLFDESEEPFNIMINGVRTIDGNHQWLVKPPRYIRRDASENHVPGNLSYSPLMDSTKGFRLYQDEITRQNVFNKIFLGPVNAAIESPSEFGLKKVIPSDHPYKPCDAFPFPDGEGDNICVTSWLIPILSILL